MDKLNLHRKQIIRMYWKFSSFEANFDLYLSVPPSAKLNLFAHYPCFCWYFCLLSGSKIGRLEFKKIATAAACLPTRWALLLGSMFLFWCSFFKPPSSSAFKIPLQTSNFVVGVILACNWNNRYWFRCSYSGRSLYWCILKAVRFRRFLVDLEDRLSLLKESFGRVVESPLPKLS